MRQKGVGIVKGTESERKKKSRKIERVREKKTNHTRTIRANK